MTPLCRVTYLSEYYKPARVGGARRCGPARYDSISIEDSHETAQSARISVRMHVIVEPVCFTLTEKEQHNLSWASWITKQSFPILSVDSDLDPG